MSLILNIETASTNCSVALAKEGVLLAIREENTPNYSHSEQLHVFIEAVLAEAKYDLEDLDAIAVSKGPGSYTGLRIGVSAAKGLCFSLGLPLISIPTLESMAHQVTGHDFIIPLLDARRMEVYAAVFDKHRHRVRETRAEIVDGHSFKEFVQKGKVVLLGSGAEKCKALLMEPNIVFYPESVPSAREMASLSYQKFLNKQFEDVAYFEPFYLKDFLITKKQV
jgi:tRNA threonylcarbamoyladenosine biosynthesis protein TsaB